MSGPRPNREDGRPDGERLEDAAADHVAAALKGLRFGQVVVTVQDGVIVQIDRTERRRFSRTG